MIKVIDNILTKSLFTKLTSIIMSSDFSWHYGRTSMDSHEGNLFLYGWYHTILSELNQRSFLYNELEPIIMSILDNAGENFSQIIRIRVIANTITDAAYQTTAHVDLDTTHNTALFYLHNSDGDTQVYEEMYDISSKLDRSEYRIQHLKNKLTLEKSITPVANRLVCFNGLRYHNGTTPIKNARRVVININYI